MIRIYQRLGPGAGVSMPGWLYLLIVIPAYLLIGATMACYYVGKYIYVTVKKIGSDHHAEAQ